TASWLATTTTTVVVVSHAPLVSAHHPRRLLLRGSFTSTTANTCLHATHINTMPATRAQSTLEHAGSEPYPRGSKRHSPDVEVIVISSDDEDTAPPRKKRASGRKPKPGATDDGIEVIKASARTTDSTTPAQLAEIRRKLKKAEQERDRLKKALDEAREQSAKDAQKVKRCEQMVLLEQEKREKAEAQAESKEKADIPASMISTSSLEDIINCEICTLKMWSPFILSDCGHVFCQKCLNDWFQSAMVQHMTNNPNFRPELAPLPLEPGHLVGLTPHEQQFFAARNNAGSRPKYSCPSCRAAVKHRPAECYSIKALVRLVAEKEGEKDPREVTVGGRRGKGRAIVSDPWEGYFGRAR
ncbi:hypothetical protein OF83DRAFT_709262, partial [Amylostereum chailletii]